MASLTRVLVTFFIFTNNVASDDPVWTEISIVESFGTKDGNTTLESVAIPDDGVR